MNKPRLIFSVTGMMVAASIFAACNSTVPQIEVTTGVVLENATIIGTRDGKATSNMSLILEGGKVKQIVPAGSVKVSGAAQTVDALGKFVVPGYLDMHAHTVDPTSVRTTAWPLFLANGVTGFRQMNGSAAFIARAREINAQSAAGTLDAPEVLQTPGEIFGGQSPTAAGGAAFVDQQKAAGADFMKVTGGSREAILAVLAESKAQNLYVAGHETAGVGALESSNLGWHSFEHLGAGVGHLLDCSSDEAAVRQALAVSSPKPPFPPTYTINPRAYDAAPNGPSYARIVDTFSAEKCKTLAATFVKNDTWEVPTLIRLRTQNYGNDAAYRNDPNLKYVDKATRGLWQQVADDFSKNVPESVSATLKAYYEQQPKLTKLMKDNGVKMLAGSDTATIAIWVIPGFSLHQEFRELSKAGLTPLDILQMTTLNGAQFLGREATMGTVEAGKEADLVLLDANPIQDAANLDRISGVVLNGKYFSQAALEQMKAAVAAEYAAAAPLSVQEIISKGHKD